MEKKAAKDFMSKFNELNTDNQRYLIAIQQALAFAQSSSLETKKTAQDSKCGITP